MVSFILKASLLGFLAVCGQCHYFDDPTATGAFPLDTPSFTEASDLDTRLLSAAVLGEGPECSISCNDESYGLSKGNGSGKGVDCWGTFKAFCKGSGEKVCGFGGYKCEGHFVGFKTPCGTKIGICAGATKKFGKILIKPKEDGPAVKIFKAGGGIGTSGVAMASPNMTLPARIQWPASLAHVQDLQELYSGAHNSQAGALTAGPLTLKKAFGDGAGGGLVAVKKVTPADAAKWAAKHPNGHSNKDMTFAKMESKAERKLQKLGYSLPVEPSVFNVDMGSELEGADCEVTCNGKPAWFKGGFPCYGYLKVKCAINVGGESKLAPSKQGLDENVLIVKKAGCKGFWSGVFGHKCTGFSYAKTEVKAIDKYAYCSGKKGIFKKKKDGAFIAGGSCFGKGLYAVQYTPESSTDASAGP